MTESLKILLLEDNPEDAEIVQRQLKRANFKCVVKVATNKETYLQALDEFNPAIILSDNHLPQFSAEEALIIIQRRSLLIPFILYILYISFNPPYKLP
ncbi:MAG: response regulator [Chitinophagaceae bacterium]